MILKIKKSFGLLLILFGALLILQNLNIFKGDARNILWAIIFGGLGIYFLTKYFSNRTNWIWIIPGIAFIGFVISNAIQLVPNTNENISGIISTAGIGISFLLVYLISRENWWALIPSGIFLSLSAMSLLEEFEFTEFDTDGILFLGLGVTFLLLYVLPNPSGRLKWAIIPASIMLLLGILISIGNYYDVEDLIFPALIIFLGILILINSIKNRTFR